MKKILVCILSILVVGGVFSWKTGVFNKNDVKIAPQVSDSEEKEADQKDYLILVNKTHGLDENYKPKVFSKVNISFVDEASEEERQMEEKAAKAVEELVNKAAEEGIYFLGSSAYRSFQSQKITYQKRVLSQGQEKADAYVAKPGYSEHQTGLCIDLTNEERWFVGSTKEAKWLEANANKYGFILRYPKDKEDITGISYEPWHIRYVGEEAAYKMYVKGLTLEEYLKDYIQ